jgi:hypothetical protein
VLPESSLLIGRSTCPTQNDRLVRLNEISTPGLVRLAELAALVSRVWFQRAVAGSLQPSSLQHRQFLAPYMCGTGYSSAVEGVARLYMINKVSSTKRIINRPFFQVHFRLR